jgi:hypothetical protein
MMKYALLSVVFVMLQVYAFSQFNLEQLSPIPEPLSNGAIEFGRINQDEFVYIWGSLDSTRSATAIHQRGYKLDVNANLWTTLPDLPDTTGKLALSASRIGDIIYVVGGYHVLPNGSEVSSDKVHRFSISQNAFLSDASPIPVAIDDQVQIIYRDSLIYVITGWSNTGNVGDVQVFDPQTDTWNAATPVPVVGGFRAFGASGCIVGDTIYYFGGASSIGINFPASNRLCKGYINPENPLEIAWESSIPDSNLRRYRSACIVAGNFPHWVGGSSISYNYDGIAYNGSGAVAPSGNILEWNLSEFEEIALEGLPMDIRAVARMNDSTWVIAGGMIGGPQVSDFVWKLSFSNPSGLHNLKTEMKLYPVPVDQVLKIETNKQIDFWSILDYSLQEIKYGVHQNAGALELELADLCDGVYWLRLHHPRGETTFKKFIKR